jgi:Flp pilus assembly protein TadG
VSRRFSLRSFRGLVGRARDDERGFVLIFFTILLVTLLALAGFAVDFWHWNNEGSRLQKAADAAALGGSVFMPENTGNIAFTTAKQIASKNGYTDGQDGVKITVKKGVRPNQLKVIIEENVENYFGALVGASNTTIVKHAVGEYERSVNMGSPINQFGNNPEGLTAIPATPTNAYPQFWANVFGPKSGKGKGDAYQSNYCSGSVDNCSGTTNLDYDTNGYFYGIEVASGSTGPLQVDVFDPAFAHVGDNCGNTNNLSGAAALPVNFNPQFAVANPSVRYNIGAQSPYCTGDMYYSDTGENGGPAWTTYHLRGPDDTPNDPTNNPIVCSINFPGYNADLKAALQATTPQANAPALFVAYFRQWYRICTVNNPDSGNYFLQVQTKVKADGTAAPQGSGANRFAVRAGLNDNLATPNLRVYGEARIGIYANSPAANTTFYLARVLPGAKGRNLIVHFFDTGDAAAAGTLTVLPPPDSTVGATFPGCTYTPPPGTSTGPPWGTFQNTQTGCKITNVSSATFNGQWVQFKIPIPDTYDCAFTDANGCWARINFAFPSSVQDTTTWTARVEGDPVRLVE